MIAFHPQWLPILSLLYRTKRSRRRIGWRYWLLRGEKSWKIPFIDDEVGAKQYTNPIPHTHAHKISKTEIDNTGEYQYRKSSSHPIPIFWRRIDHATKLNSTKRKRPKLFIDEIREKRTIKSISISKPTNRNHRNKHNSHYLMIRVISITFSHTLKKNTSLLAQNTRE